MKFAYLHEEGCGGVAFYLVGDRPNPSEVIKPENVRLLDGTVPLKGDLVACGTCGIPLGTPLMAHLVSVN